MSANPHANGGLLLRDLDLPDFRDYAVDGRRARRRARARRRGCWATSCATSSPRNPDRVPAHGPGRDGVQPARRASSRSPTAPGTPSTLPGDDHLAPDGRVMEVLSEHLCQGWLEGYLLTGRHGLFNCYEAFIHIIDSMFNQHAKWLKTTRDIPWRRPIASLNYLLSSHVWRQDHNGFSHQDPGFIDHVVNKKAEVVRVYLPPDANTPAVGRRPLPAQPPLRQRHRRRQAAGAELPDDGRGDRALHPRARASGTGPATPTASPTSCSACAGDVPTLETLAAADLLRQHLPELKVRVVNVVDLMRLQPDTEHPHGLPDREFDALFTTDKPVIFAYPRLSVADPPAHLPAHQPPQHPRARLQGGGHDHHAVRHGDAQRPRPLPPGHGRHRPGARPGSRTRRRCARRWSTPASPPACTRANTARTIRRSAGLDLARAGRG